MLFRYYSTQEHSLSFSAGSCKAQYAANKSVIGRCPANRVASPSIEGFRKRSSSRDAQKLNDDCWGCCVSKHNDHVQHYRA